MTVVTMPSQGDQFERLGTRTGSLRTLLVITAELFKGFRRLHFLGPCVTVFGSARLGEGTPEYDATRRLAARLAARGFAVVTGGGPGLMEAANRGARDVGGTSVGCTIRLPHEQRGNKFLDLRVDFDWFLTRKFMLLRYSYAFVVMPGGFGTLDELFEALTQVQTGKMRPFPIVVMGDEYWSPLRAQLANMLAAGTIAAKDLELVLFTDDVDVAASHVEHHAVQRFGLARRLAPSRLLGESRP